MLFRIYNNNLSQSRTIMFTTRSLFVTIFFSLSLTAFSQPPKLVIPLKPGMVTDLSLSPDDKKLVSAAFQSRNALLWDVQTGTLLAILSQHPDEILHMQYPSKDRIFTYSPGLGIIWDANTATVLSKWKMDMNFNTRTLNNDVGFNEDGSLMCISRKGEDYEDSIQIVNTATGEVVFSVEQPLSPVYLDFSPDGKGIMVFTETALTLYSPDGKEKNSPLPGSDLVQVSADRKKAVIRNDKGDAFLWDVATGKIQLALGKWSEELGVAEFSKNSELLTLATKTYSFAATDRKFAQWNVVTAKEITRSGGSTREQTLAILSNGQTALQTLPGEAKTIVLKDAATGNVIRSFKTSEDIIRSSVSADEKLLALVDTDEKITVFDLNNGRIVSVMKGQTLPTTSAFFSAKTSRIISEKKGEAVQVWDTENGKLLGNIHSANFISGSDKISPDGSRLLMQVIEDPFRRVTMESKSMDVRQLFNFKLRGTAEVWDPVNLTFIGFINQQDAVEKARFSQDGKYILTQHESGASILSDAKTVKPLFTIAVKAKNRASDISPDGKSFVLADGKRLKKYSTANGAAVVSYNGSSDEINNLVYSPDGKQLAATNEKGVLYLWDEKSGALIDTAFINDYAEISRFSPDNKLLLLRSGSYSIIVRKEGLEAGEPIDGYQSEDEAYFSGKGDKLIYTYGGTKIGILDLENNEVIGKELGSHIQPIESVIFSNDGETAVTISADTLAYWNTTTGEPVERDHLSQTGFADNKVILVSTGVMKIYDLQKAQPLYSVIGIDSTEYIYQLPSGHYMLSNPAITRLLHYVTPSLDVLGFEQLDVKYNRPDLVMPVIGHADTALTAASYRAYQKRLKKLGIDINKVTSEDLQVPVITIKNKNEIAYEQNSDQIKLQLAATDNKAFLDRMNIYINGVPAFHSSGLVLKGQRRQTLDTAITIRLIPGENLVEASVINDAGFEANRIPLRVKYTPVVKPTEMVYFLGIGIDRYADTKHNLQYSVKDIRDLAVKFKKIYKDRIIIDTLFDEAVTTASIMKLRERTMQSTLNDRIILAFSGHGLLSRELDYYLSTYSVDFKNPEQNGMSYEVFESLLDGVAARKKLMLIDACHSGDLDKEEVRLINKVADSLNIKKGGELEVAESNSISSRSSYELMKDIFLNVSKSTGATIISASGGTQFAIERSDLKNGAFTFSILELMEDLPTASVQDLKRYVNKRVPQLTGGMQKPTSRADNNVYDWRVW
jgi:WD40 repeat protein